MIEIHTCMYTYIHTYIQAVGDRKEEKTDMEKGRENDRKIQKNVGIEERGKDDFRLGQISENVNGGGISCLRLANNICRRIYTF